MTREVGTHKTTTHSEGEWQERQHSLCIKYSRRNASIFYGKLGLHCLHGWGVTLSVNCRSVFSLVKARAIISSARRAAPPPPKSSGKNHTRSPDPCPTPLCAVLFPTCVAGARHGFLCAWYGGRRGRKWVDRGFSLVLARETEST
jgi:hypothetical protein